MALFSCMNFIRFFQYYSCKLTIYPVVCIISARRSRGAHSPEPDGQPGGQQWHHGAARVHGHRLPHEQEHDIPAAVQDTARVVPLRLLQQ